MIQFKSFSLIHILFICLLGVFSGCSSDKEIERLKQEIQELKSENTNNEAATEAADTATEAVEAAAPAGDITTPSQDTTDKQRSSDKMKDLFWAAVFFIIIAVIWDLAISSCRKGGGWIILGVFLGIFVALPLSSLWFFYMLLFFALQ